MSFRSDGDGDGDISNINLFSRATSAKADDAKSDSIVPIASSGPSESQSSLVGPTKITGAEASTSQPRPDVRPNPQSSASNAQASTSRQQHTSSFRPSAASTSTSNLSNFEPFAARPVQQYEHPGYQRITSIGPTSKRPLWSLGSTLPRVKRVTSSTSPSRARRPNPQQSVRQRATAAVPEIAAIPPSLPQGTAAPDSVTSSTPSVPASTEDPRSSRDDGEAVVYSRDYASGQEDGNQSDTNELRPVASASAKSQDSQEPPLPKIEEGAPLQADSSGEFLFSSHASDVRPAFVQSLSSPDHSAPFRSRPSDGKEAPLEIDVGSSQDGPQATLARARAQLIQEAQQAELAGHAGDAQNSSAIDDRDWLLPEESASRPPPEPRHVKSSSMPFLPSQVPGIHVGRSEADKQAHFAKFGVEGDGQAAQKRPTADNNRRYSAQEQARHPGLSGARPPPRGRAAGGPAVGVGTRRPSAQSNSEQKGQLSAQDPSEKQYHQPDDGFAEQEQSSTIHRAREEGTTDHIHARPVGGRTTSQRSTASDARNAWMQQNMPNMVRRRNQDDAASAQGDAINAGEKEAEDTEKSRDDHRLSQDTAIASTQGYDDFNDQEEGEEELWLGGQNTAPDGSIHFPTTWSRWRYHSREFLAELLATTLLLVVGTSVDCQVTLSQAMGSGAGSYPNQNWAWGLGVASTIYLSGGRSGAHCNPAVTLALAVFRGFPWIQVPIYWSAQLLGAFLGAAITYGLYLPAINHYEGGEHIRTLAGAHGSGRLFVTVPDLIFTRLTGFSTEVTATSILMAMILAVGDETNSPPSDGLSALVLGFVVVMIGMCLGWPTSYAISPSRDLGPRLFLYAVGYGKELWTHNDYWWIYGPQAGCFVGALLGGLLYDLAIFTGEESPINYTAQGWRQSTPARVWARVHNSADRASFFMSRKPAIFKPSDMQTANDKLTKTAETNAQASSIRQRRQSRTSQQLEDQENGFSVKDPAQV